MGQSNHPHPSQRRYPPELRERAVRMVRETAAEDGQRCGVVTPIAGQVGIGPESIREWVRQAEVDRGLRGPPGRRRESDGALDPARTG